MPIQVNAPEPRLMPVILLLDTSGSMGVDGKIATLNDAVSRMINAFKQVEIPGCQTVISVVSFGGTAKIHIPATPVSLIDWKPLGAAGNTPMGAAFQLVGKILQDPTVVPERSFRTNLVLVSDGIPTDDWEKHLSDLDESSHGKQAMRFAVGVGADVRLDILKSFAGKEGEVVPVDRVELLTEFFKYVTYTVTQVAKKRPKSQTELPTFKDFRSKEHFEF
jgi:uncharacterized protein YegL